MRAATLTARAEEERAQRFMNQVGSRVLKGTANLNTLELMGAEASPELWLELYGKRLSDLESKRCAESEALVRRVSAIRRTQRLLALIENHEKSGWPSEELKRLANSAIRLVSSVFLLREQLGDRPPLQELIRFQPPAEVETADPAEREMLEAIYEAIQPEG